MNISKEVLGSLERTYATSIMKVNGETNYIVATEGQGAALSFSESGLESKVVWTGPGGTMNIVSIPGRENEFIATQKFFPTFQAQESMIVHAKYDADGEWKVTPIMDIPYLHSFDVLNIENKLFFIGASLCESKEFKDDWSKLGKVFIGELSNDITKPFELKPILEGATKNHGFFRGTWDNNPVYLVSGVEGIFAFYIPESIRDCWKYEKILDTEVSDMAVMDIDGDGIEELATIEGFHGDKGKIYKKINGKLQVIHEHQYEFGHVVWGGNIAGTPSFIIGGRKGNRDVVLFQYDQESGSIKEFLIDNTGGTSNITVINKEDKDVILAANREIGEIALYEIKK